MSWFPNTSENGKEYSYDDIVGNASNFLHKGGEYCGVYFLICDDEIVYVGKSVNIKSRLDQHSMDEHRNKNFNKYYVVLCDPKEVNSLEAYYILKFRPKYNIAIPRGAE